MLKVVVLLREFFHHQVIAEFPKENRFLVEAITFMLGAYFLDFTLIGKYPLLIYFGAALSVVALCLVSGQRMLNGKYYYAQYVLLLYPLAFAALLYRLHAAAI